MANKEEIVNAAKDALLVQNACNLSGIVLSLGKHLHNIPGHLRNNHPVSIMFIAAQLNLQGLIYDGDYVSAHSWCDRASKGEIDSWEF